jgi:CHASE3 domain sensor protein
LVLHRWWLDRSVRAKGLIVVAVPLIALIAATTVSMALQYNERRERAAGRAASSLTTAATQVLTDALNGETGVRGYAATRTPVFLAPYTAALARVATDQRAMRDAATAEGESTQAQAVETTAAKVFRGLSHLRSAVSSGAPAATLIPALATGKKNMDELRRLVAGLIRRPSAALAARTAMVNKLEMASQILTPAGSNRENSASPSNPSPSTPSSKKPSSS